MDDPTNASREKLAKALREVAELKAALDRAEGKIKGVRIIPSSKVYQWPGLAAQGNRARIGKTVLI